MAMHFAHLAPLKDNRDEENCVVIVFCLDDGFGGVFWTEDCGT